MRFLINKKTKTLLNSIHWVITFGYKLLSIPAVFSQNMTPGQVSTFFPN